MSEKKKRNAPDANAPFAIVCDAAKLPPAFPSIAEITAAYPTQTPFNAGVVNAIPGKKFKNAAAKRKIATLKTASSRRKRFKKEKATISAKCPTPNAAAPATKSNPMRTSPSAAQRSPQTAAPKTFENFENRRV